MRTIVPKDAKLIPEDAQKVFTGKIYDVHQWEQKMYDGSTAIFEMLKRQDTVKILAIKDNKIVVTKESQPHIGSFCGFPGGRHDEPEENELEAAQRELKEETGLICNNWKLLSVEQPSGHMEWFVYLFLAWNVSEEVPQNLDAGEKINVELYDVDQLKKLMEKKNYRRFSNSDIVKNAMSIQDFVDAPEYKGE